MHTVTTGKESKGLSISMSSLDRLVYFSPSAHLFVSLHKLESHSNAQSKFVTSPEGIETQKKVWVKIAEKLEKIQPSTTKEI